MTLDWPSKARHAAITAAFCLAIALLYWGFAPDDRFGPQLAYSLSIGMIVWACIDLGRHAIPSARETGWPQGAAGWALIVGGIAVGYLVGSRLGDLLCRSLDLYGGAPPVDTAKGTRTTLLISIPAGLVGSYFFYSMNQSRYLARQAAEARQLAAEARLKLLEAQLEPHMLFNTLANLRALIGTDPPRALQMLDHMNAYLRATLVGSRAATHPLSAEFERLSDYLALMAIRMGPRLAYALDLPRELATHAVPTLLLQPLVENSIQHGLEPQLQGGRIDVRARRDGAHLLLEVVDTGRGPGDALASSGGFGLAQVRERLQTLHGDAATLEVVAAAGGGTRAVVRLPATQV